MSKTIDQRVVELQFDNSHFEKNVKTSMSTLEKLKHSLNLSGASKGLENISAAAKNHNLDHLSGAAERVGVKFSMMQIAGVTSMVKLANAAIDSGEKIAKALTIDPIRSGFNEYELKMGSIQTIMASTGEDLSTVNKYLNELNKYSDQTIYSFQDMTSNIGKFTNAGVKLEDAVSAIKGISNEAAVSGANANEASRAMYNFAQALSSGYVKLIDWKSIENANMATVEFKNLLIESAVAAGTLKEAGDGMYETLEGKTLNATKNFNDTLQDQWMTSEVLINTLQMYSDESTEIGKKATQAATQVKTLSQMLDTLKESAQSGWATTWEIVFGNFLQARDLWTGVNNFIGGFIDKMSDARNTFLKNALSSPWEEVEKQVSKAGISVDDFKKSLMKTANEHGLVTKKMLKDENGFSKALDKGLITKEVVVKTLEKYTKNSIEVSKSTEDMSKKLKDFQKIVDKVWRGDFKNGQERMEALTKAGYNYKEVQDLVNKSIDGHKLKLEDLSDAQLKSVGYTEEEVKELRKLEEQAKKTGTPLSELLDKMSRPTGRYLLIDTFANFAEKISDLGKLVGEAWKEVFGDSNSAEGLYDIIDHLHEFSKQLNISEENAEAFKNIMAGVFSGLDLTFTLAGKGLVGSIKILNAVLGLFGTDILGAMEFVATKITALNDFLKEHTLIWDHVNNSAKIIHAVISGVYDLIKALLDFEAIGNKLKDFGKKISEIFNIDFTFKDFSIDELVRNINKFFAEAVKHANAGTFIEFSKKIIDNLVEGIQTSLPKIQEKLIQFGEFGKNIIEGIVEGIQDNLPAIKDGIVKIAETLIETFKSLLGIHSPSKVFIALGGFLILGLIKGIDSGFGAVWNTITTLANGIIDTLTNTLTNVDWGAIFVGGVLIGSLYLIKQLLDVLKKLAGPFGKLGDLTDSLNGLLNAFKDAVKLRARAEAIKTIAISFAILAGSLIALSFVEWPALAKAGVALAGIALGLAMFIKMTDGLNPVQFGKLAGIVLAVSFGALLMASAIKKLSGIDFIDGLGAVAQMGLLIGAITLLFSQYGKMVKGASAEHMDKAGWLLIKMSVSLGLMAMVIKYISKLEPNAIFKGLAVISAFELMIAGIIWISKYSGANADKAAALVMKMGITVALMSGSIKLIASIPESDIIKGLATMAGFMLIVQWYTRMCDGIGKTNAWAGNDIANAILKMGFTLSILAIAMRIVSGISTEDVLKGIGLIALSTLLFKSFAKMSDSFGPNVDKAGSMIWKMSLAIGILAVTMRLLSGVSNEDIIRGMLIVAGFEVIFGILVRMVQSNGKHADKVGAMLTKMSVAILILVGAIALLSLLKPEKVATGTAAVTALMLSFAAIIKSTEKAKLTKKTMSKILMISGIIAAFAGIIALLSLLDPMSVLASSAALSLLMISFVSALTILGKSTRILKTVQKAMVPLLGVTLGLAAILAALGFAAKYCGDGALLEASASLSMLLITYTAALSVISKSVGILPTAFAGMGILLAITAGLALILGLLSTFTVGSELLKTSAALSLLLLSFSAAVVILGTIGAVASAGIDLGLLALTKLVAGVGLLITALGGLDLLSNGQAGKILDKGIELLSKIGKGIGGFIGSIGEGVTSKLPAMGEHIGTFMKNLGDFDPKIVEGVKSLAETMKILLGSGFKEVMSEVFTGVSGEDAVAEFGSQLNELGDGLKSFADKTKGIDDKGLETAAKVFDTVVKMAQNLPRSGGLAQLLAGEKDLAAIAAQLPEVGGNIKAFATNLGTFSDDQVSSIKCGINAIKAMSQAAEGMNGQADWAKFIFGDNGIAKFASELPAVGGSLAGFVQSLGTFSDDQVTTIKCAINALKSMMSASEGVNGQAGWAAALFGDNSITAFATKLPIVGAMLSGFAQNLGAFSDDQVSSVKCAANAIKVMAEAGSSIDGQAGWAAALFGDNSLGKFSEQLPAVGTALKNFVGNLGSFGEDQIATVNSAVKVVKAMANLAATDLLMAGSQLPMFGNNMASFGDDLKSFCDKMADVNSGSISKTLATLVDTVADTASKIIDQKGTFETAGTDLINALKDGITSKTDSISSSCEKVVIAVKNAITDKKEIFKDAGETLMNKLDDGVSSKDTGDALVKSVETLVGKAATAIDKCVDDFESAGKDLGNGLVAGIEAKYQAAYDAGYELGQKAVQGEKDGQKSNSPSKLTIKAGKWLGEGLVVGMKTMGNKVYNAGHRLGDEAATSLTSVISGMTDLINTDIDAQPTIRPVLDLSDVKSGVGTLDGMFGNKNIGVVNSMMSRRSQNGVNDDVVDAINKLSKRLDNIGNTTYSVNGVNVGGSEDVADAFRTIVRGIKVGGRA